MAGNLSPLPTSSTAISTSSLCPSILKTHAPFVTRNQSHANFPAVSCKARNDDHQNPSTRRDVLIGLGGLYGATNLSDPFAHAKPIQPPDISDCSVINEPDPENPTNCCPPLTRKIIDFKLPSRNDPLRIRRPAHLVDDDYIAKYNRAIALMKQLPEDDPRNFTQQANVHCAYCDGGYHQVGMPDLNYQVHFSWLFFPWHRYYLYFYERILGKLIDDPTFALPFWNWDSPQGMQIPAFFADPTSAVYDPLRDKNHQPPKIIDLDFPDPVQVASNLNVMYRQMVTAKYPTLFMGRPYRAGDEPEPGAGSLEDVPHTTVHIWTGDADQANRENMGVFYAAARDPIFFAHHGNIDRLWEVWKKLPGGKRQNFTDPDWLDAAFLFYDENANLVRVKIRDCLDTTKLRYGFQDVASPGSMLDQNQSQTNKADSAAVTADQRNNRLLNKTVSVVVQRPNKRRSKKDKEEEEEVLVIEGIEYRIDMYVKFNVLINDEPDTPGKTDNAEFAGTFVNVPHSRNKTVKTSLRLGITELLEDLEAEDDESVVVTLVPITNIGEATIGTLRIELLSD
uniref:Tyrosinase copper-binding domain-containing protein n=1 Tax=Salix viminalis TaxID=40686 RepID=A0A6N2NH22_SALVM